MEIIDEILTEIIRFEKSRLVCSGAVMCRWVNDGHANGIKQSFHFKVVDV